mmetsp:Transcript_22820/g.54161  ORF Transcript_22820/g.54161 Transcript_22820/m.54161 type:complete len:226 (-) Transcript_22820:155-832(-)
MSSLKASLNFSLPASSVVQPIDQMTQNRKLPSTRFTTSAAPIFFDSSSSLNSVMCELRSFVRLKSCSVSLVATGSLHSFLINRTSGGTYQSKSSWKCFFCPSSEGGSSSSHDSTIDCSCSMCGSMSTIPFLLTVAGDAAARSSGSNIIVIVPVSLMISPLFRHSFLLSSITVFMFSIQMASTGPSNRIHLRFGARSGSVSNCAHLRTREAPMPSTHSRETGSKLP